MKNWMANKIEDMLDNIGCHSLATKWFHLTSRKQWYQPHYKY